MPFSTVNVGLIGLGTVGGGVARALLEKSHLLEQRVGAKLVLRRACDRGRDSAARLRIPADRFTTRVDDILRDPDIHIVVELIGGVQPAKSIILQALRAGKHVVTANKALLAEAGAELFGTAERSRS